jgi:hypothetical protein
MGTLWTRKGLTDSNTQFCQYKLDSEASDEHQRLSGCNANVRVPLENFAGEGQDCGHWSEFCYNTEILSSQGESEGIDQPISRVTIAGLEDLGYGVDYRSADPFTVNSLNEDCVCDPLTGQAPGNVVVQEPTASRTARTAALAYGRALLTQRAAMQVVGDSETVYIGDQVVSIAYLDQGVVSYVVVTP